jgi:Glucose / Sorbosone dehydrogenase
MRDQTGNRGSMFGKKFAFSIVLCVSWAAHLPSAFSQVGTNSPNAISPSTLGLRLDSVGSMPRIAGANPTSPVAAGNSLLLVDQAGEVYRWGGRNAESILSTTNAPIGINPVGPEKILNVASNDAGNRLYVVYTSSTVPLGTPTYSNPRAAERPDSQAWQVIYGYNYNGTTVSNPTPISAFQVYSDGHTGGGLNVLSNGKLLFAVGDNGDAGEDGRRFAQDSTTHLGKLLVVDPNSGAFNVAAQGVRNPQRLVSVNNQGTTYIGFADIGGKVAEEINFISADRLLSTSAIANFGWGRNADSLAREGAFYIDPAGNGIGVAPPAEAGFIQPFAQWGREGARFVAGSGPVLSDSSFSSLSSVFGDLASGKVYGTLGDITGLNQTVFELDLYNSALQLTNLDMLAGGRADPRFFNFADGSAGLLLERTGEFFTLTEINSIPAPSVISLIAFGLVGLRVPLLVRRARKTRWSFRT